MPSNGQRTVGGHTPLNGNAELKAAGPPLEARERIERVHALQSFDSIPADDLRGEIPVVGPRHPAPNRGRRRSNGPARAARARGPLVEVLHLERDPIYDLWVGGACPRRADSPSSPGSSSARRRRQTSGMPSVIRIHRDYGHHRLRNTANLCLTFPA